MKSIILLCVFVGAFLIITGIYEEKIRVAELSKRIEYKFIPRSYLEEQLANDDLSLKVADSFNFVSPWFDRTVGALADIPDFRNMAERERIRTG